MTELTFEELRREFKAGEWASIDAIEYLQEHHGLSSREAEALVEIWEGKE